MNDHVPSNVQRLRELADDRPDQLAYVHLTMDGSERALTWSELDRRSNQVAGASRRGCRLRRPGGPRDQELAGVRLRRAGDLEARRSARARALGRTGLGARAAQGGDPAQGLHRARRPRLDRATSDDAAPDLPEVVSPNSHGICSSGATGTPKVILSDGPPVFDPMMSVPIAEAWLRVTDPNESSYWLPCTTSTRSPR